MRIIAIDAIYNGYTFTLNKLFGFLLQKDCKIKRNNNKKIDFFLNIIANPYYLNNTEIKFSHSRDDSIKKLAFVLAKLYTKFILKSFFFVRILSVIRVPIFETTQEAILFYRKQFPGKQQELCLPRALFAASTSKSFKKESVVFIGVFLPSRAMHAWIIENNMQPDPFDDIWICYQPVAAIYNA